MITNTDLNSPTIAIAILNYNGQQYLERFLPYVLAATYSNKSIWVIDNASSDDSLSFLHQAHPSIHTIQLDKNYGFAEGYNLGLQHIEADYYVLLNSDVEVTPNFIEPVIQMMEGNHQIAFAQPKLLDIAQRNKFEYAGAAGGFIDAIGYPFCQGRVLETVEEDEGQYNGNEPVFWASGCCLFARASVYKELNGFYAFLFMQNEDIDLCWRAQNRGYEVWACSASTVYHMGGGSLSWQNPQKVFYTFRNNLIMLTRNMPIGRLTWVLYIRWFTDYFAAIRYLLQGRKDIAFAVVKGMLAFLKWLLLPTENKWPGNRSWKKNKGKYNGLVVWQYFVKKKQTSSAIKPNA
jgi:GT2 family glycosyltransferase